MMTRTGTESLASTHKMFINGATAKLLDGSSDGNVYTWDLNLNGLKAGNQRWVSATLGGWSRLIHVESELTLTWSATNGIYLAESVEHAEDQLFRIRQINDSPYISIKQKTTSQYLEVNEAGEVIITEWGWRDTQKWLIASFVYA